MFKKLRDKISEEVQQTSLRLPATVQHLSQLSPFGGNGGEAGFDDASKNVQNLQDELLVDISDIQPAGDNKDLFSIDEDSREASPSKSSEFQVVELTDENISENLPSYDGNQNPFNQSQPSLGIGGGCSLPNRRLSDGSQISEMGNLFPIYEVPGVSFSVPQSDLESCSSEWEEGSNALDRLSKDTVYQAYLRMRQRYHKYKGRYSDLLRVYKEKEKETERLRDVLTKQQDKALRRISELREQCSLEQQAKAHLEEELRSDLEEKDHKIEALQTKVRLLQEGCFGEVTLKGISVSEGAGLRTSNDEGIGGGGGSGAPSLHGEFDTVSVGSLGSLAAPPSSVESEEIMDKLKDDLVKHKTLLGRCMDNIRTNKERIANLLQERDAANVQLKEKDKYIESLKIEHEGILESLRATLESSALSMAETKQQLFEELQTKEEEVERYRRSNLSLQKTIDRLKEELAHGQMEDEEVEINLESQSHVSSDEISVKSFENLELKVTELENLIGDLQRSKMNLEMEVKQLKEEKDSGYFVTGSGRETSSGSSRSSDQNLNSLQENVDDSVDGGSAPTLQPSDIKTSSDKSIKTQDYVELADQLKKLQVEFERLKSNNEALSSELRNLNDENESLNAEVSSLNDENESLHKDFKSLEGENEKLDAMLKEKVNKYNEDFSGHEAELSKVKTLLNCTEKENNEIKISLKKMGDEFEDLKKVEIKLKGEIANLNESLNVKCSLIEKLEEQLNITEKETREKSAEYLKTNEEINNLKRQISELDEEVEKLKACLQSEENKHKEKLDVLSKKLENETKQTQNMTHELGDMEDKINQHVDLILMNNKISVSDDLLSKLEAVLCSRLELESKTKDFAKENDALLNKVNDLERRYCDLDKVSEKYSAISIQFENLKESFKAVKSKEKELNILNEELNNKLEDSHKEVVRLKDENSCFENTKLEMKDLIKKYDAFKVKHNSEIEKLTQNLKLIELERSQLHQDQLNDRKKFETQIIELENQKGIIVSDLKIAKEHIESRMKETEELQSHLLKKEEKISLLEKSLDQLNSEKNDLLNQIKSFLNCKEELSNQLQSSANEKKLLESQLSALKEQFDLLTDEKESLSLQILSLLKENEDLSAKLGSLSREKESLSIEFNSLLHEKEVLENMHATDKDEMTKTINNLLSEKEMLFNSVVSERDELSKELAISLTEKEVLSSTLAEKEEISNKFTTLLTEKEELSSKLDSSLAENEELSNKYTSLLKDREELSNLLKMNKEELSDKINDLVAENDKLSQELSTFKTEREKLFSQVEALTTTKEETLEQLNSISLEKKNLADQLNELIKEKDDLADKFLKLSVCKEELSKQLYNTECEKDDLLNKIQLLSAEETKLNNQLNTFLVEKEEFLDQLNNLKKEKENLSNQINSLIEDKSESVNKQNSLSGECQKLSDLLNTLRAERDALVSQLQTSEEEKKDLLSLLNISNSERENILENHKRECLEWKQNLNMKDSELKNLLKEFKEISGKYYVKEEELKDLHIHQEENEKASTELRSKKEELELLVKDLKSKLSTAEENLAENSKILDQEWQEKLRLNLEKLQAENNERLAEYVSATNAAKESEKNHYEAAAAAKEESFRQSLEKRDSEIIRLMDEKDFLRNQLEDKQEEHRQVVFRWEKERQAKEQQLDTLREELLETKCQLDKQVQELENSNSDLRLKIDELQNELNHLETISKVEILNETKTKEEKRALEEQLKEKALQVAEVLEEKLASEQRLNDQMVHLTKTVEEMKIEEERLKTLLSHLTKEYEEKKDVENKFKDQIFDLSEKIERMTETEKNLLNQISCLEDTAKQTSGQVSERDETIKNYTQKILEAETSENLLKTQIDENADIILQLRSDNLLMTSKISELEGKEFELVRKISELEKSLENSLDNQKGDEITSKEIDLEMVSQEEMINERLKTSELVKENEALKKQLQNLNDNFENSVKKLKDELLNSSEVKDLKDEIASLQLRCKEKNSLAESLEFALKEKQDSVDSFNQTLVDILEIQNSQKSNLEETSISSRIRDLKNENLVLEKRLLDEIDFKEQLNAQLKQLRSKLKDKDDEIYLLLEKQKLQKQNIQEMIGFNSLVPKSSSDIGESSTSSEEAREKAIQEAIESCKTEIYAEYEERLNSLRKRHEQESQIWKAEVWERAVRKEDEMKAKMEELTVQTKKEKKELQRLTKIAENAFKSGSESMDHLRDQVAKQRLEIEETKRKHQKEVEELKALLEVKRRKGRGGQSEFRNAGGSLEDAAEFEYLRNILYQYMIGKETQTLAKVLCAVVKFNREQQRQIIEQEDRKQSLLLENESRVKLEIQPLSENT